MPNNTVQLKTSFSFEKNVNCTEINYTGYKILKENKKFLLQGSIFPVIHKKRNKLC